MWWYINNLEFSTSEQSWYVVENKRGLILQNKAGMCPSCYNIPALTKNKAKLKTED
jgi:hypothetical protein